MKIEEQVLSIEQMKHLQELGVDTADASMFWVRAERIEGKQKLDCIGNDIGQWHLSLSKHIPVPAAWKVESIPTYTIGDLIEKLPDSIDGVHGIPYNRKILIEGEYTEVCYTDGGDYCPFFFSHSTLIRLLYNLFCVVAENHKELLKMRH